MKFLILALCVTAAMAGPTADQIAAAKASWNTVKGKQVDILYAVFKANSDIQDKFPQFAGKDLDSIKGTPEFATHAGRIVGFFSNVMDLLGNDANTATIVAKAKDLGKTHKSRATAGQFDNFRKTLVVWLKGATTWDSNVESSWNAVLDFVFGVLKEQLAAA
ncbi:globin CTT-I/CTT-IA-like [Chironomus tepperi]|uniref:globin CTT-I/CTT-IA-like n=1 Tax=Chironomus tepperi TaxID=113505 RepID=UPI00391F2DA0